MSFTLKVHEYGKVPGSPFMKIVKSNHYIRLSERDKPPLYIQNGRVWSEGGQAITNLPDWFKQAVARVDQKQLEALKFDISKIGTGKEIEVKAKRAYKRKNKVAEQPEQVKVEG